MKTAIISSKTSTNHLTGDGHPEQPKRVTAITERLKKNKSLIWDKPISFDENILKKICDAGNVDKTNSIVEIGPGTGNLTKYLILKPL